jgi:uncharacterized RDD family membrane protein YckC
MAGSLAPSAKVYPDGAAERQGLRAGIASRVGAMIVDAAYVALALGVVYLAVAGARFVREARSFTWPAPSFDLVLASAAIVTVLVLTIAWSTTGRSAGKRVMGLRLVGPDGSTVGPARAFLRAAACVAFPIGLGWAAVSRRNASLQDLLFRTSVVYDWHMQVPAAARDDDASPGR